MCGIELYIFKNSAKLPRVFFKVDGSNLPKHFGHFNIKYFNIKKKLKSKILDPKNRTEQSFANKKSSLYSVVTPQTS